jgi:hypothetical protein
MDAESIYLFLETSRPEVDTPHRFPCFNSLQRVPRSSTPRNTYHALKNPQVQQAARM